MSHSPHHPFRARLSDIVARSIRAQYRAGVAPRELATQHQVAMSTIFDVISCRTYRPKIWIETDDQTIETLTIVASASGQTLEQYLTDQVRRLALQ